MWPLGDGHLQLQTLLKSGTSSVPPSNMFYHETRVCVPFVLTEHLPKKKKKNHTVNVCFQRPRSRSYKRSMGACVSGDSRETRSSHPCSSECWGGSASERDMRLWAPPATSALPDGVSAHGGITGAGKPSVNLPPRAPQRCAGARAPKPQHTCSGEVAAGGGGVSSLQLHNIHHHPPCGFLITNPEGLCLFSFLFASCFSSEKQKRI